LYENRTLKPDEIVLGMGIEKMGRMMAGVNLTKIHVSICGIVTMKLYNYYMIVKYF
jgi:hypothetical protein